MLRGGIVGGVPYVGEDVADSMAAVITTIISTKPAGGWWKLDEASSTLADSSGNARTLNPSGFDVGDYRTDSPSGYAIGPLNGTDEYANNATSPFGTTLEEDFAVSLMVKGAAQDAKFLFSAYHSVNPLAFIGVGSGSSGASQSTSAVRFRVQDDIGGDPIGLSAGHAVGTGFNDVWHHVVCQRKSGNYQIWVDGSKLFDSAITQGTITLDRISLGNLQASSQFAAVSLKHLVIWNSDFLSDAEIASLYASMGVTHIKPAGGGDFTTLQTWADAVDTVTLPVYAECYSGGDLGALVASASWAPSTTHVYAATGSTHTGISAGTSGIANTTGTISFLLTAAATRTVTITGLYTTKQILGTIASGGTFYWKVEKCLMVIAGTYDYLIKAVAANAGTSTTATMYATIKNNALYIGNVTSTSAILLHAAATGTTCTASLGDEFVYNNSISRTGSGTITNGIEVRSQATGGNTANVAVQVVNNAIFGTMTANFKSTLDVAGGSETNTFTGSRNNASSDATGDDFVATGALVSQTASDWFVSTTTDVSLKAGSPGINAGYTLGSMTEDIVGHIRPYVGSDPSYDIGCFESSLYPVQSSGVDGLHLSHLSHLPHLITTG